MNAYYEYILGFSTDIFELLEKGYGYYNKNEFMFLLNKAKIDYYFLQEENNKLKQEIATINVNVVASLERDLLYMKNTISKVIKPKCDIRKTVEQLDV
jgi:hypothetical protein